MLTAKAVSVARGSQVILDKVSLSVGPGTRLGIVGPNGIGKSTLLRVLAGLETADAGEVERNPASLSVGYLSQEPDAGAGETVRSYLARRTGVAAAEADLDAWTATLAEDPDAVTGYSDALERYLSLGGDDFEARASAVCADLGLRWKGATVFGGGGKKPVGDLLDVAVGDLSGGQAARAGLAAILLSRFEVIELDEPTNDLDFAGLERLEGFLASLRGGVVVVSHDRAFLDRVVDRIVEIDEHHHQATEFAGGWSEFVERRALARSQAGAAYEAWQRERAGLADRIRTQRSWSEEGVRKQRKAKAKDNDRLQRGFKVNRTEKQASKVRTSERALARLGVHEKPWEGWQLHLDLSSGSRSGDVVARLEGAVVTRGNFSLGPVDLEIGWAERVAVMGSNGGGKSTLLAALVGHLPLSAGRRWLGPGVVIGELDQRRARLAAAATLVDGFVAQTGVLPEEARSCLAKFGLGSAHAGRRVDALSPGERTRAQLAALMVTGTNCLILDEPTNHLDLPAIEQLESALEDFEGTLLLVSHDRWLLESMTFDRHLYVADGHVSEREPSE